MLTIKFCSEESFSRAVKFNSQQRDYTAHSAQIANSHAKSRQVYLGLPQGVIPTKQAKLQRRPLKKLFPRHFFAHKSGLASSAQTRGREGDIFCLRSRFYAAHKLLFKPPSKGEKISRSAVYFFISLLCGLLRECSTHAATRPMEPERNFEKKVVSENTRRI